MTSYSMYSDDGDKKVHEAMLRAADRIEELGLKELGDVNSIAHNELRKVAMDEEFLEAADTAVRERYISRLTEELEDRGIDPEMLDLSIYA